MIKKWKIIKSELAFDNKWFKVRKDVIELPSGKVIDDYFMWKNNEVVLVVAITDENKMVLVKQYKHAVNDILSEFPAGYIEKNEDPQKAAQRELLEETGYESSEWKQIGKIVNNPSKEIGNIYIFLAENAKKTTEQRFDETEEIEVIECSINKVLEMFYDGKFRTSGSIAALFLAIKNLNYKI